MKGEKCNEKSSLESKENLVREDSRRIPGIAWFKRA